MSQLFLYVESTQHIWQPPCRRMVELLPDQTSCYSLLPIAAAARAVARALTECVSSLDMDIILKVHNPLPQPESLEWRDAALQMQTASSSAQAVRASDAGSPGVIVMDCSRIHDLSLQELRSRLEGLRPADVPAQLEQRAGVTFEPRIRNPYRSDSAEPPSNTIILPRRLRAHLLGPFHFPAV